MDYKTTYLQKDIEDAEELFPELSNLRFGLVSRDQLAFDSTFYLSENKLQAIDYRVFSRCCKVMVEALAKEHDRRTSELFYVTPNKHVWIASELVFLYIMFVNPEMLVYFNSIIGDAISDGVAYSDGFAYNLAARRLPADVLQTMIKEQKDNDKTENK